MSADKPPGDDDTQELIGPPREAVREVGPPAEDEARADEARPAPTRSGGRLLGFLGLVVGLAGLGLAGYLYYLLVYSDPLAALDPRFAALEANVAGRAAEIAALKREQRDALADFAAEQKREREASADRLLEAVNKLATQAPPSRREWKIAEVAYLLRIANNRVLMERDADGALTLLKAADAILTELDDFSLYQVRAQLADEILALENVQSNDLQGLFLRLEAVKTTLSQQAPKLPRMAAEAETVSAEPEGFWSALTAQLGSYLRFRRFDGEGIRPLLAPEESVYLELNLRLMLERAQLAALRREQVVFEQSLNTAANWMDTYLDSDNEDVRRAIDELMSMSRVQLDRQLPDISGSLTALKEVEGA